MSRHGTEVNCDTDVGSVDSSVEEVGGSVAVKVVHEDESVVDSPVDGSDDSNRVVSVGGSVVVTDVNVDDSSDGESETRYERVYSGDRQVKIDASISESD